MPNDSLLQSFTEKVDEFEKYQGFIAKTRAQGDKFSPAIVEKVVNDNTAKSEAVISALTPLVDDLRAHVALLGAQREEITSSNGDAQFELDVLTLRHVIGEIDDAELEDSAEILRELLGSVVDQVTEIDLEVEALLAVQKRWSEVFEQSGLAG